MVDDQRRKDGFSAVLFSHRILKINKGNKSANRAILITNSFIYKLDPGKGSKYKVMSAGMPIANVSVLPSILLRLLIQTRRQSIFSEIIISLISSLSDRSIPAARCVGLDMLINPSRLVLRHVTMLDFCHLLTCIGVTLPG